MSLLLLAAGKIHPLISYISIKSALFHKNRTKIDKFVQIHLFSSNINILGLISIKIVVLYKKAHKFMIISHLAII